MNEKYCQEYSCLLARRFAIFLFGIFLFNSSAFAIQNRDANNGYHLIKNNYLNGQGTIVSESCHRNNCVALGYSENKLPILLNSNDGGKNWQLNASVHFPQDQQFLNFLNAITYFDQHFFIATNDGLKPFILNSDDDGITWKQADVRFIGFSDDKHIILSAVTCHNHLCFVYGFTPPRNERPYYKAFILSSVDNGDTWIKSRGEYTADYVFSKIAFTEKSWILVGKRYAVENIEAAPAILVNHMNGSGWQPAWINIPGHLSGQLNDVSCQMTSCMAVGEYLDVNKVPQRLVLESNDAGNTWKMN